MFESNSLKITSAVSEITSNTALVACQIQISLNPKTSVRMYLIPALQQVGNPCKIYCYNACTLTLIISSMPDTNITESQNQWKDAPALQQVKNPCEIYCYNACILTLIFLCVTYATPSAGSGVKEIPPSQLGTAKFTQIGEIGARTTHTHSCTGNWGLPPLVGNCYNWIIIVDFPSVNLTYVYLWRDCSPWGYKHAT